MKKESLLTRCAVIAMLLSCMSFFCGCFGGGESQTNTSYTIQYTDDAGPHTLSVTSGMPYSLENVPYKYGYEFLGLFDAQTGGTQYVSSNGSSLAPYTDKENKVLFPQFKAIDYTVVLDYQGAAVTGERSLTVPYGSALPELPKNLVLEHHTFAGWYTEPDGKGTKIADAYGNLPVVSVLNETNFKLDDTTHRLNLYAAFELETYTVTFYFDAGMPEEEVEVPYNTSISRVVPKTRNSKGEAVLVWSRLQNDTSLSNVFDGKVKSEMVLYVAEWAPVIELNTNGGDEVIPVVARAGSTIALPTPTKSLAKFLYWETIDGKQATITTMPSASMSLKAIWQGKIEFDENGGSEVNDISEKAGTSLSLPVPEKEGYIFAGWYTAEKEQYTSATMPSSGVALKAGWYKEKTEIVTVISSTTSKLGRTASPSLSTLCFTFDYSSFFNTVKDVMVKVDWHTEIKTEDSSAQNCYVDFYSQKNISSIYLLAKETIPNVTDSYKTYTFSTTFTISDDFYICWYMTRTYYNLEYFDLWLKDFYYTVHYPDTTYLYL